MSYTKRTLEELNIMDDFLMNAVASNGEHGEEFCRLVLSTLLGRRIEKVQVVNQRVIQAYTPKHRGIRMDVEVVEKKDGNGGIVCNVYDIEPHNPREENLPRRNRFYQARMDGRYLKSGEKDFSNLPNLWVITITPYDPFGKDYMMYTIRNHCEEVTSLFYEDGLTYVYFNTRGKKGGSPAIRAMLDYFENSREENAVGDTLRRVHQYVSEVKILPEVRDEFMTVDEYIRYFQKQAAEETAQECRVEAIISLLEDYGELSDELIEHINAQKDPDVLKKWLKLAARADSLAAFEKGMQQISG